MRFFLVVSPWITLLSSAFFFKSSVHHRDLHSFPTRRSSDLLRAGALVVVLLRLAQLIDLRIVHLEDRVDVRRGALAEHHVLGRSEEHTSELQSQSNLVCRLLREKKKYRMTSS